MSNAVELLQEARKNAPDLPPISSVIEFFAESEDDDEEALPVEKQLADGQSFIIEYMDSRGNKSERAITVLSWDPDMISAKCHLRKSVRTFRVDRIAEIRDFDGVYADSVVEYLADNLGMPLPDGVLASPKRKVDVAGTELWQKQRSKIAPFATLWSLLAFADMVLDPRETKAATDGFVALIGKDADRARFAKYFSGLKPTEDMIYDGFDRVRETAPESRKVFATACEAIIRADGEIKSSEVAMLKSIALHLKID